MCGRYTLTRHERVVDDLQASLGASTQSEWWKPRFNVAPTQPAPVVVATGAARTVELMRWGLVPFWAKDKGGPLMINARVENLKAKAFFREALAQRRCLVPADGFFEWLRTDAKKPQPIYFHPADRHLFAFAGLWARADDTLSFTIITGKPNDLVRPVHDRMPLVLAPEHHAAWLDPAVGEDAARALLGIPADAGWIAEPVSTRVNKADHDDPECIAPVLPEEPRQRSLF